MVPVCVCVCVDMMQKECECPWRRWGVEGDSYGGPVAEILVYSERQGPRRSSRLLPERSQKVVQFPPIRREKSESLQHSVNGTDNKGLEKVKMYGD